MRDFILKKYGDSLLFALALAVLATVLFNSLVKKPGEEPVPVVVFSHWWQDDIGDEFLQNLVEEFESQHVGIRIILNGKSYEELRLELFSTAPLNETRPGDVFALDSLWVPGLVQRERIESAAPPMFSFINVLYYNIGILTEAGFTRPPKTRSEFLRYARALANKPYSALGLALDENNSRAMHDEVYPWLWAAGAQLIRDGKPVVNSRPVSDSLAFLASLNSEGLITPGAFHTDTQKKLEDFISGRTAFMIAPTRYIGFIRERMGDEAFSFTSIPVADNQAAGPFLASSAWTVGIHADSAHREEARLFAAFLAGKISPPADAPAPDTFYSKVWDISLSGEAAQDFSGLAVNHELDEIFREGLLSLFAGTAAAEAAGVIQAGWQNILENQNYINEE